MHKITITERKGNDLTLDVTDEKGTTVIAEVTLFADENFNARVGSHHVSEEMRNDINHYLAEQKVHYQQQTPD